MMKKLTTTFILTLILINCSLCFAGKMETFLKVREELYHLRNNGLAAIPLLNIINQSKRAKQFKRKYKYLQKLSTSPELSSRERDRMQKLMRFDRLSDYSPKNPGHGMKGDFYTTPYGLKVSTSCFKILEKASKAKQLNFFKATPRQRVLHMFSKAIRERGLEHIDEILTNQIERAIDKVVQCGGNYPYARKFTDTWLKSLKKTRFYCDKRTSQEAGEYAHALDDHFTPLMNKTVVFTSDSFLNFILDQDYKDESHTEARNTFIHELFHLSQTDNRWVWNHNDGKSKYFSDSCDAKDRVTDRVYLLGALCSGQKINVHDSQILDPSKDYFADELVAEKVKQCGLKKGCVRHFSEGMNTKTEAARFCKNIVGMGQCRTQESSRPLSMEKSKQQILRKLVGKIKSDFSKCKDYLNQPYIQTKIASSGSFSKGMKSESFSLSSLSSKQASDPVKRPEGCPSVGSLTRPENFPLSDLYALSAVGNLQNLAYAVFGFKMMKFLKAHPRTSDMLSSAEWNTLLKYFREKSFAGRTKICKEKMEINSTVYKARKPISIKVDACTLPR